MCGDLATTILAQVKKQKLYRLKAAMRHVAERPCFSNRQPASSPSEAPSSRWTNKGADIRIFLIVWSKDINCTRSRTGATWHPASSWDRSDLPCRLRLTPWARCFANLHLQSQHTSLPSYLEHQILEIGQTVYQEHAEYITLNTTTCPIRCITVASYAMQSSQYT